MTMAMTTEQAACGFLKDHLLQLGNALDAYLQFKNEDALVAPERWQPALAQPLPQEGIGLEAVLSELSRYVLPNAAQVPKPGFTSFITTGATSAGVLTTLAGAVAAPQRIGLHSFNFLEDLSLRWLAELFGLPKDLQGVYTSGGSVANLVALGAARQYAFERLGIDAARSGVQQPARIFASVESHHSIQRACAVLGLGRDALVKIPTDEQGRVRIDALTDAIQRCDGVPMAIVGNLGTTNAGVIDPISELARLSRVHDIWLHLDGAYGLPGILDPVVEPQFAGMEHAHSVVVDPHKWLGAPVGIGAAFVRDAALLQRAFTQEPADYLEGTLAQQTITHSMDSFGTPYSDMSVELSSPCRGAVVWALLREIGRDGMRERICRHNAMARYLADQARGDSNLELLREPTLSICCFRYVDSRIADLDELNRRIHRRMVHHSRNMPSTTQINGKLAIRPCFIGARTGWVQAESLLEEVRSIGAQIAAGMLQPAQ